MRLRATSTRMGGGKAFYDPPDPVVPLPSGEVFTDFADATVAATLAPGFSLPWQTTGDPPHIAVITNDTIPGRKWLKIDNTGATAARRAVVWNNKWLKNDIDLTVALFNDVAPTASDSPVSGAACSIGGASGTEQGLAAFVATKTTQAYSTMMFGEYAGAGLVNRKLATKEMTGSAAGSFKLRMRVVDGELLTKLWREAPAVVGAEPPFWQGGTQQSCPVTTAFGAAVFQASQNSYVKSIHVKDPEQLPNLEVIGGDWPEEHANSGTTTVVLKIPTNVKVGDLMLASVIRRHGFLATPAGWTMLEEIAALATDITQNVSIWYKRATEDDVGGTNAVPKTLTWQSSAAVSSRVYAILAVIRARVDWAIESSIASKVTQVGVNVPMQSLVAETDDSIGFMTCTWGIPLVSSGALADIKSTDGKTQQFGSMNALTSNFPPRSTLGIRRVNAGEDVADGVTLNCAEVTTSQEFARISVIIKPTYVDFKFDGSSYTAPTGDAVNFSD